MLVVSEPEQYTKDAVKTALKEQLKKFVVESRIRWR